MQNNDFRAKQFIPFDALKGFKEELRKREEVEVEKRSLTEDECNLLNDSINMLKKKMIVRIIFYDDFKYIELKGVVTKLDKTLKYLYIVDKRINFDDIIELSIISELN